MTTIRSPDEWVGTAEAAELTGYSRVHLRRLAEAGKVKAIKVSGHMWLISMKSLVKYLHSRRLGRPPKDTVENDRE